MNAVRSLGRSLLLALALVGAWIPAAMTARTTASAPEAATVEVRPASDPVEHLPAVVVVRDA